ncbi:MAG: FAD-dependent oxidoreductase [Clostridia bacterium]|nr:FAD-dependent oxidoreductase [Clostridia bacterium]
MLKNKYDLIVAGSGLSGVAAALSAAREGLSVLIFDKSNCAGGAAVNCLVNPFMPYWTKENNTKKYLSAGIFKTIVENLKKTNVMSDDQNFNEEYLKLILNRMLIEAGVDILFHSYLIDAETENELVKSVTVANKSGKQVYYADYFVDATGDGDLSVLCGCPYHLGREKDNLCQPMTLCFRLVNVDLDLYSKEKPKIQALYKEYKEQGKIKNIREDVLSFRLTVDNVLHFNSTRIVKLNPTDAIDITHAEIEAREQVFELYDFLRKNFESCKNSEIIMTAPEIGVRESRMIEGEYILTKVDLIECKKFEDSIAAANYDIDIHNPEGSGTSHHYFKPGEYYTIPYRCLTPKRTKNLLVAGRCISSTHEAQASYRVMPICCCLGEAAGMAAAQAFKEHTDVKSINIKILQKNLKENGAFI